MFNMVLKNIATLGMLFKRGYGAQRKVRDASHGAVSAADGLRRHMHHRFPVRRSESKNTWPKTI